MKLSERLKEQIADRGYIPSVSSGKDVLDWVTIPKEIEALEAQKDGAYKERDMLVALLAAMHVDSNCKQAYLARDNQPDRDDDWRWVVYISTAFGQLSWHIHDSEYEELFKHIPYLEVAHGAASEYWDGHTTEEKYKRITDAVQLPMKYW